MSKLLFIFIGLVNALLGLAYLNVASVLNFIAAGVCFLIALVIEDQVL